MTFVVKHRGDLTKRIVATYTCVWCGPFDAEVQRDENGNAPDKISCHECGAPMFWTPSPIACRVRRFEVVRGGWEKPERPTFLDTRKLGEGQNIDEFRSERKKVWDEKRWRDVKEMLR